MTGEGARMGETEQNGKKWVAFTVIALTVAAAVLIGAFLVFNHQRENYAHYSPDQITEQMIGDLKLTDLEKVEGEQISKHYDIPSGIVSDSSLYMSKSAESASELACFLLTDASKYKNLQTAVTAHINAKAAGYKSLNPTQYNALKNYLILHSGRYVLVAVGSNTEDEKKWFKSQIG